MPPGVIAAAPLIGAGLSAAGGVAGALIGKKGNKEASDASLTAQREALAYEREKEARAEAAYKMRMDAWNANRRGLMARYGIGGGPGGGGGGPMNLRALVGSGGPPQGMPPEMAAHGSPPGMPMGMPQPQPMDMENWNDWGRYAAIPKMG